MKQIFKVVLAFAMLASFGFAKSNMIFGKNTYLGENSLIFEVKNSGLKDSQIGQITHKPLIICDNNLSGFIEYTKKDLLTYYSLKPLVVGVNYNCKINPKYSNKKSKAVVLTDYFGAFWVNFETPNVARVVLNDKISNEEFYKGVKLLKVDKLSKSKLGYKIEKTDGKVFVLRLNEDAKKVQFDISANIKSIHGIKANKAWKPILDDEAPEYKSYKDTKELVFYDEPSWGTRKDGKITIRVFTKSSFYSSDNIRKFIKISGIKDFSITDSNWVSTSMQKKYSLDNKSWSYMDIVGDFKPHTTYKITFLKGFGNRYYQLANKKTFSVKTGDFGSYVGFEDDKKPYISSYGDIGIRSVNVNDITIVIDKMLEQNLRYFINFDNEMSLSNLSKEVVNKKFTIGGKKNQYTKHKIPLKEALKGLNKGVYQISIHYGKDKYSTKKVYLSDIGVGAKVYEDGIFVWTSSLKDTSLIKNAKVEVFSKSNMLIAKGYTNEFGVFQYDKKDFLKQSPSSVLVTKGDEQNFLILNKSVGNEDLYNISKDKKSYDAYVYFQSKLIRPDENLFALVVLKDKEYKSLKNAPVNIKVFDPVGKVVYKDSFKTDEKGAFSLKVPLVGQKTGQYRFEVSYADETKVVKNFLVEAFLPQKIKNSLSLPKGFIKADSYIEANASSNYLFGAPAAFLKGDIRLRAVAKEYKNPNFKDYSFTNRLDKEKNSITYIDQTKSFTLNKNGAAITLLSTHSNQKPPSILDGQVELSVLDDGRKVSTYKNIDIYPYDRMVGLDIKSEIIDTNTPVNINTILINPFTNEKQDGILEVYIGERNWYYNYDSNGYYKWNEEVNEIGHMNVKAGESIEKIFTKSGDYVIVVQDIFGLHSSSVNVSVRGWDYASINPTDKISKNQVKFKDKLYKKGDLVKLDIKTPIKEGKMLVTLEGEKIYWYEVVEFKNAHVKVDVPLDVDLKNGLYIHTIATRATDTPSTVIPFRAISSDFIKPDRTRYKLNPLIKSVDTIKSNTSTPIHVKAKPNSKVIISVVDDGILQILGQKPPRPFDYFNKKAPDLVADFDIYDLLMNYLTKGKKLSFGSGAVNDLAKSRKHLSPETGAKRVKPFVYFSKLLHVNQSGEVLADLKIPSSFNGSATIVAIEISDNAIGANSKKITIKDDIIIKPIYPRYGNVGDSWVVPVRVFNTTDKLMPLSLSASTNTLLHVKGFDEKIELKPNSSKVLNVGYEVKGFGKGEAKLSAKTPKDTFSYDVELPLVFAYPLDTYNVQGESKTPITLKAPEAYMKGFTPRYSLSVSGDVLSRLRGGLDYLVGYPYGCTEQTSSKMLALLNMKPFINTQNKDEERAKLNDRIKFIKSGINKLSTMQKTSGAFGYWESGGYVNTYASIYASDVLYSLNKDKFEVPNYVLKGVKKSLKSFANLKDKENYFNRVYATYLLATQNVVDVANVNYIYDKKIYQNNLPSIYMMAYVLKKARMDSEMKAVLKLAEGYDFTTLKDRKREYGRYFYSYPRDIAFALYLHVKHFGKNQASKVLFDRLKKEFKNLYSTQDRAFALRALGEYFKDYKKGKDKFAITGVGVDEIYEYEANLEGKYDKNTLTLTPQDSWINYNFSVMQYLPKSIKHVDIKKSKKPLKVYRTFVDKSGKKVDLQNLKIGDTIYSKVILSSNDDMDNIVVNQQIPSCFEIVNERIAASKRADKVKNSKNFKPNYIDIRDDKILTFLSLKNGKSVTFLTPLQVTTKGTCLLPPLLSEAMYDERISDYDLEVKSLKVK